MKNCFEMKDYEVNVIMPMLGRGERMQGMQNTWWTYRNESH